MMSLSDDIANCPMCWAECVNWPIHDEDGLIQSNAIHCSGGCGYLFAGGGTLKEIIEQHNRLCERVQKGKAVEAVKKNPPMLNEHNIMNFNNKAQNFNAGVRAALDAIDKKAKEHR